MTAGWIDAESCLGVLYVLLVRGTGLRYVSSKGFPPCCARIADTVSNKATTIPGRIMRRKGSTSHRTLPSPRLRLKDGCVSGYLQAGGRAGGLPDRPSILDQRGLDDGLQACIDPARHPAGQRRPQLGCRAAKRGEAKFDRLPPEGQFDPVVIHK